MKKKLERKQPARYEVNRTLGTYQPSHQTRHETRPVAEPHKFKEKRAWSKKKSLLLALVVVLTPLLIIGGWDLSNASKASNKLFGSPNVAGALLPTSLDNDNERVNILMVGYSADDPEHAGAKLTDSIMVISLDKEDKTGYMLSVPRDLYVNIPDYGSAKINEAYQAGGISTLQKVVSDNFNIPIHYYVLVNYGAVRGTVDALGGVNVNIQSPDPRGILDPNFRPFEGGPLKLANGVQAVDGQTALRLTRARGSTAGSYGFPQSDFNRTQNQQQVFVAIKKELSWKLILDPRTNGKVFDAMASNTQTDLEINEVLPLFRLFRSVPDSSMRQINLRDANGVNLLASYQTRSGQSALVPAAGTRDFSDIQAFIKTLE